MMRNKKIICHLSLVIVIAAAAASPLAAFAHPGAGQSNIVSDEHTIGYWGPLVSCAGAACTFYDMYHTALHLIFFGMTIALYLAAPVLFAWGGITILISAGNPGKIGEGKKILTGTAIGVVIILLAYLIVKTLISILGITGVTEFS